MDTFKKVWDIVTTILVGIVLVFALLLVGARLIGFNVFTVLSGSMEPTYHTGSLIYVKDVDYTELEAGDVITFMLSEDMVATHRIVGVVPDEEDPSVLRYRTKGDANEAEDATLVHYKNVIGTPVFTIPYLGYVTSYIQSPPGSYVAVAVASFVLLLAFLPDIFSDDDEDEKSKKNKKTVFKAGEQAEASLETESEQEQDVEQTAETAKTESQSNDDWKSKYVNDI